MAYCGTPPASSQNCACWPVSTGSARVAALVDRLAAVDGEVAGLVEAIEAIAADGLDAKAPFVGLELELGRATAGCAAARRRCR